MNAIKLDRMKLPGPDASSIAVNIMSIRKDSQEAVEIARFRAKPVQFESEVPRENGQAYIRSFTGWDFEMRYTDLDGIYLRQGVLCAIGATVYTPGGGAVIVLPQNGGLRSVYGNYPMHTPNIIKNSNEVVLQPKINYSMLIGGDYVPFSLVISYCGIDISVDVEQGPCWVLKTNQRLMSFEWSPAQYMEKRSTKAGSDGLRN